METGKIKKAVFVIMIIFELCVGVLADELFVPSPNYPTIQSAINDSNEGDVIIAAPGTYYENIRFEKDGVKLQGAGAESTIIEGDGNGHVVVFNTVSGTISGFTIENSGNNPGYLAGIFTSQCNVRIENCIITNNNHGITFSSNSDGFIVGNEIINNDDYGIKMSSSTAFIASNVIVDNLIGVNCSYCSPFICNNTITGNQFYGIQCDPISVQFITNNIVTNNECGIMALGREESPVPLLFIAYNNVWNNTEANYWASWGIIPYEDFSTLGYSGPFIPQPGTGEISQNPYFSDSTSGNFHLQSEAGRWDPNSQSWVTDANTSECIDAGDPNSDWTAELWPHGALINMGAYGGTPQASMSLSYIDSIADLDHDGDVDCNDLMLFTDKWPIEQVLLAEDLDRNGKVDFKDYAIFANEFFNEGLPKPLMTYEITQCEGGILATVLGGTRFTVTVEGHYIHFEDMMQANCCPAALWLEMYVGDESIIIFEKEYGGYCFCICDYPVDAELGPFKSGTYTLEVYEDYGGFIGSTIVVIE